MKLPRFRPSESAIQNRSTHENVASIESLRRAEGVEAQRDLAEGLEDKEGTDLGINTI
jgi:hypothetical protein